MKKHINIPVFIPHLGCPNQCVFCNQRSISGTLSFSERDALTELARIVAATAAHAEQEREIAFFGGSFTGIDRARMVRLLDSAEAYVRDSEAGVRGIRFSTRPDYITPEILDILQNYTITTVELGLQSFSDEVLRQSKRGHTAAQAREACWLLRERGISFTGQMMIGLPGASQDDEIRCAEELCALGASSVRVYPTVVFRDTELAELTTLGIYQPLSEDEAVERTKETLRIFDQHGVPVLRVGLCASENLHGEETYLAGPNHSAVGELAKGALFYEKICAALDEKGDISGHTVVITSPKGTISQVCGQKKRNKIRIQNKYNVKKVKAVEMDTLTGYNIKIDIDD